MKTIKLRDAHEQFRNFLKENKRSNSTIVAYAKDIEQLVKFLEELAKPQAHDVKKEDIEDNIPTMWRFLKPYIDRAYSTDESKWWKRMYETPFDLVPKDVKEGYKKLLLK